MILIIVHPVITAMESISHINVQHVLIPIAHCVLLIILIVMDVILAMSQLMEFVYCMSVLTLFAISARWLLHSAKGVKLDMVYNQVSVLLVYLLV